MLKKFWWVGLGLTMAVLMAVDLPGSGLVEPVDLQKCFTVACSTVGDGSTIAITNSDPAVGTAAFRLGERYRIKATDDTKLRVKGSSSPGATFSSAPEPFAFSGAMTTDPTRDAGTPCWSIPDTGWPDGGPLPTGACEVECLSISGTTTLEACKVGSGVAR